MQEIPENLIPWLLGGFVLTLFGFRGLYNYRRIKTPLSKYFAITGISMGIAFFLWSLPFIFTTSEPVIRAGLIIGDIFFYTMLLTQTRVIWHLRLQRINYMWLFVPAFITAFVGWFSFARATLNSPVGVVDGLAEIPVTLVSHIAQAILLTGLIIVAILVILEIPKQKTTKHKLGLLSIAALYLGGGVGGIANLITLEAEANTSPIVFLTYMLGFVTCAGLIIVFKFTKTRPK
jgi:hypothetical protein